LDSFVIYYRKTSGKNNSVFKPENLKNFQTITIDKDNLLNYGGYYYYKLSASKNDDGNQYYYYGV
jgi:hypothetical protein